VPTNHQIKKKKHARACCNMRRYQQALPYQSQKQILWIISVPMRRVCPLCCQLVLDRIFYGKDIAAHGGAAEASADHSIFSAPERRLAFPSRGRPPPRHLILLMRFSRCTSFNILLLIYWGDSSRGGKIGQVADSTPSITGPELAQAQAGTPRIQFSQRPKGFGLPPVRALHRIIEKI
jgi:hypothetical protein